MYPDHERHKINIFAERQVSSEEEFNLQNLNAGHHPSA